MHRNFGGKGGRFGYGARAPGRLVARPDELPGSHPPGAATPPAAGNGPPAGGNTPPAQQPNPARQQLRTALFDFVKGVYDQPGDANVADYLGGFTNGAWQAPTGMSTDLASAINGMLGNKPRFAEKAGSFLGEYGAKPVPDSILSRLMQRGSGQMPFGLYGMGMAGMMRGHLNGGGSPGGGSTFNGHPNGPPMPFPGRGKRRGHFKHRGRHGRDDD